MPKLKFAMVCYSNQNRSMEAHKVLQEGHFDVCSYGVGSSVRLPGPSQDRPNVYEFGTPYDTILQDLLARPPKEQEHYRRLGIIDMLERNRKVKRAPEKWQTCEGLEVLDVVITFEERVMDLLVEDMVGRAPQRMHPVLVINLDVPDNNQQALDAAPQAEFLCQMLEESEDWVNSIDHILEKFEDETGRKCMYTVVFF